MRLTYIQQQLKKLCDNPNWYDDMLILWDKNPRNQREAIYNLSLIHIFREIVKDLYIGKSKLTIECNQKEIPQTTLVQDVLQNTGFTGRMRADKDASLFR